MSYDILIVVFVLASICLHLNIISKVKRGFDPVIRIVLIFLLLQLTIEFIGRTLTEQYRHIGWVSSFCLMYSSLLYIAYLSSSLKERKKTVKYIFSFLLAIPCYILFALFSPAGGSIDLVYSIVLYVVMALSWFVYIIWAICLGSKQQEIISIEFQNLLSAIAIIMLTLAVFYAIMAYIRGIWWIDTLLFLDLGMLSVLIFIYRYTISGFKEGLRGIAIAHKPSLRKEESEASKLEYQKSSLKEEAMVRYSERVDAFIESGAYLDAELSLSKIATELRIPKHHLSQLFSQYYKRGLLEYVNTLRIRHACGILDNSGINVNIADLAEQCGFKSKPSFYRNFKNVIGMTPTEFQSLSK